MLLVNFVMLCLVVWLKVVLCKLPIGCIPLYKKNCSAGMKKKKNMLCSSSFSFPVLCRNISDLN